MSSVGNFTEYRELSVFFIISDGKVLPLFASEISFAKGESKTSAFSLKSVRKLFS